MMHCTLDDLLALRAGEASVQARRHLNECGQCRSELDALYQRVAALKALPALGPSRDRWPLVRASIHRTRRQRRTWSAVGLAAAATVAALIALEPATKGTSVAVDELANLKEESATLESEVAFVAPQGRVISGREAALGGLLEDQIASIDGAIGSLALRRVDAGQAQLVDLWRQRVDLMRQLYTVRVTRAAYMGL
jgi:hypothetical protein